MENMGIDTFFWKRKKVFLTGHTGFKGSWLSLWLHSLGAEVFGYSLEPPTNPNLFHIAKIDDEINSIYGDIRDLDNLKKTIFKIKPEIVIHMAAQSIVSKSYLNPIETYEVNLMGSLNLMESLRNLKSVKVLVNITSDKCYENREWLWGYREDERMGGYDPYSNSKGCAELATASFRSSFFNPSKYKDHGVAIATARAGNVIGGGDWAMDRLVPDIIRSIESNKKAHIRNPQSIRPWQHVLEPLYGYLILAEKLYQEGNSYVGAWNFGPNESDVKSVEWVLKEFKKNWPNKFDFIIEKKSENFHEANLLKLDCSKAKFFLGWSPKWDSAETIKRICNWHKANLEGVDMKSYVLNEINDYQSI